MPATTTKTPDRTLAKLPNIERASVSPELATVCPSLGKAIDARNEMLPKATAARSDFERKLKAVTEAKALDLEALAQAHLDGEPDPGRKHEAEALLEVDEAHRVAEGLIVAANRVTRGVALAMKSEEGEEALKAIEERKKTVDIAEAAAETRARIGEVNKLEAYAHMIRETRRKPLGPFSAIPSLNVREATVWANSRDISPTAVLDALIDGYDPRIES